MAVSIQRQFRVFASKRLLYNMISKRALLSDTSLGMEHYMRQRIFKSDELGSCGKELLLQKLQEVRSVAESPLVAYDITDLIHVAHSETELNELERLVCLISASCVTHVSSLRFGASLMRLYHHLNNPERAYHMYKKKGMTEEAQECLKHCRKNNLSLNLELMCLAQFMRVKDVLAKLQRAEVESDDMTDPLSTRLYADTMNKTRTCVLQAGSEAQRREYLELERKLESNGALSNQIISALLNRMIVDVGDVQKVRGKRKHIT
ncbi:hypothetical protein PoB_006069100 [Plakobranchus ocellatus]|uniref:Uncharacterized protein n=1 Tax=Plakobranchus ocellatus TaxID=259542 RepID=A0AAV4CQV9_9GAST|nr:hypothetical protein PoB_006069100 [Plakobranchus ocellatus]